MHTIKLKKSGNNSKRKRRPSGVTKLPSKIIKQDKSNLYYDQRPAIRSIGYSQLKSIKIHQHLKNNKIS